MGQRANWTACAVLMLAAGGASAQQADVEITARVRAKELRFEIVPKPVVTFPSSPPNESVWKTDRINLPEQVQPRVIYRDIGIRLTITSTLPEIETIVDEALSESAPKQTPNTSRR